jgi:DNA-binding transcriptional LysR family regulator
MTRDDISDLLVFMSVADERSFTRAAKRLGTTQSALSHTMNRLEARLGLRLLTRTTRSVAPTAVGERLLETLRPSITNIDTVLVDLGELREKPAGTIRITTSEHAARSILWPRLAAFLPSYPDICVELTLDASFTDIVTGRFDAGVRLGESIDQDMIAVRIGPDLSMAVVASPAYLAGRLVPQTPHDLAEHSCINVRMTATSGLYAWEFGQDARQLSVRVDGQCVFNDAGMAMQAAVDGFGWAYVMEDRAQPYLADGRLVRALDAWCPPFPGYHLYFPSRRQMAPAFKVLLDNIAFSRA